MGSSSQFFEVAEGLAQLEPVRTYPERGAALLAKLSDAGNYRFQLGDRVIEVGPLPEEMRPESSITIRAGAEVLGTLELFGSDPTHLPNERREAVQSAARIFGQGLSYCARLSHGGESRSLEEIRQMLEESPLTPRERDVVALLIAGSSTRQIADRTGLTVATINTYLKRIFAKLGVHSRVELIAKFAGTDSLLPPPPPGGVPEMPYPRLAN